jgi:uncharacterized protein YbjT (DUF2867 family)
MSKIITILGGNGYIGSKCANILLKNLKDVKVYAVSRTGNLKYLGPKDDRLEIIKGDCLNPSSFEEIIKKSTGIIHSIGVLLTNDNNKYHLINKETCLRVAKEANNLKKDDKINFVYVSAGRGLPFPLSLKFHGYIESKRECEQSLINDFTNLNPIILRPGFVKSNEKLWTVPLYHGVNTCEFIERNLISKIFPGLGDKLQLPTSGIELDDLAHFAVAGALGKLNAGQFYSNDYLKDKHNKVSLI